MTDGLTGADTAYVCQRAAVVCVKEAVGSSELANIDISIARRHFETAMRLLSAGPAPDATRDSPHLLLAG